ncbi:unnamed protein product, partial [Didymodactylos carnosus]
RKGVLSMAHVLEVDGIEIRISGKSSNVPKNDVARLMYYFSCICALVDYQGSCPNIERYCDYQSYKTMSSDEISVLLGLCHSFFGPGKFERAKILIHNSKLCKPGCRNTFYELTETKRMGLATNQSIVIAGRITRVKKIMVYEYKWIDEHYNQPYINLKSRYPVRMIDPPSTGGYCCTIL